MTGFSDYWANTTAAISSTATSVGTIHRCIDVSRYFSRDTFHAIRIAIQFARIAKRIDLVISLLGEQSETSYMGAVSNCQPV